MLMSLNVSRGACALEISMLAMRVSWTSLTSQAVVRRGWTKLPRRLLVDVPRRHPSADKSHSVGGMGV